MRIAVVGLGYVGSVTTACLAHQQHDVIGIDTDTHKIELIASGRSPIIEPRLSELTADAVANGRLTVTTELSEAVGAVDVVLICVGTPARGDGSVELQFVERVTKELGESIAASGRFVAVAYRSTMPPGTIEGRLLPLLRDAAGGDEHFGVAMCPEFLREGSGVDDFLDPPFTVVGTNDARVRSTLEELFAPLGKPVHTMSIDAAASLKYACNAFHALKVTFANEMGRVLQTLDVDARDVMRVFVEDHDLNISPAYLRPGFAFGGSCLPKDLQGFLRLARANNVDVPMLSAVMPSNEQHLRELIRHVIETGERDVALLGLSFKPQTDDLRESPYVELAETLLGKGITVRIYDPIVNPDQLFGTNLRYVTTHLPHLERMLCTSPAEAMRDCKVALVGTADAAVARALVDAAPQHVFDLHGGLGSEIEALSGYRGIAW
ncbi:MAG TPA: nucleotide sugar dehydrogenase [Acidimicrobiia bacterium]